MSEPELMFEDFTPGRVFHSKERTVSAEEIVEFATEFDPQPMHVDEEAGKASILGGLAASGWHTSSLGMSLFYESVISKSASQGAPGVDLIEWRRPLIAGDTIRLETEVKNGRPLKSRPGIGMVAIAQKITNQRGQTIMRMESSLMLRMRGENAQ